LSDYATELRAALSSRRPNCPRCKTPFDGISVVMAAADWYAVTFGCPWVDRKLDGVLFADGSFGRPGMHDVRFRVTGMELAATGVEALADKLCAWAATGVEPKSMSQVRRLGIQSKARGKK